MNSGARYQIVVLRVYPNKNLQVKELTAIKQYLQDNYKVVAFCYGSSKNSLTKIINQMLDKGLIFSPKTNLSAIIDTFVARKTITYGELIDEMTIKQRKKFTETVNKGLTKLIGK